MSKINSIIKEEYNNKMVVDVKIILEEDKSNE
jgi:hypothetical protein